MAIRNFFNNFFGGNKTKLTTVLPITDAGAWSSLTNRGQDYDPAQILELYADALTAWRKNPIAFRIISITTDYVVGDGIKIGSKYRQLQKFITAFWTHPKNHMDLRLESMCEELSRSGDLFLVLFRNPSDGMSYLRSVTKDRIVSILTAPKDWETEFSYIEQTPTGEKIEWLSPFHPDAVNSNSVMLHYSVNRPLGALLGESDLTSLLPWLQRYSRMLEDRVRLHWALRSFLWIVTVPTMKVKEKQESYRNPPEAGSIIVKDDSEEWVAQAPLIHGADAAHDLEAVRGMIDAGSGYPPHWRGEIGQGNLATATAMQAPTERHLLRRQRYFSFMLQDILFHSYARAAELGLLKPLKSDNFEDLFSIQMPDISRSDNESLARGSRDLSQVLLSLTRILGSSTNNTYSDTLSRLALQLIFKFAGEPQSDTIVDGIISELHKNTQPLPPTIIPDLIQPTEVTQ